MHQNNVVLQTPIALMNSVTGHHPHFFPEPDKFKPERWNRDSAELPNSFSSLPFSFGRRMCVGKTHRARAIGAIGLGARDRAIELGYSLTF